MTSPKEHKTNVLGFTGTREGMTEAQKESVRELMSSLNPRLFVHGDCVGADADAHTIARSLGLVIAMRPCTLRNYRAYSQGASKEYPPEPPLDRNRKIVEESSILMATPKGFHEEARGGTWYTINYARKMKTPVIIVFPDGSADVK